MKHLLMFASIFSFLIIISCSSNNNQENETSEETTTTTAEEYVVDEEKLAKINALGKEVYEAKCNDCHGFDGSLGKFSASNLKTTRMMFTQKLEIITNGKGMMKAFGSELSKEEIEAVSSYIATFQN